VSGKRTFGEGVHDFEEVARGLSQIRKEDVKLEVRPGAANGDPPHDQARTLGDSEQGVGDFESRSARVMHDDTIGDSGLAPRPLARHARERIATGPSHGVERFEFDFRSSAQRAADDEGITATAETAERPPGHIAWLEEYEHCHACERGLALVYRHLYGSRAQPAHGSAFAEYRQAALHPAQDCVSFADVPDRAGGKPGDDRDRGNTDELHHRGRDDNTPVTRGWRQALREFLYGLFGYEIAQQALEIRASMETLFMLGAFGEMLGVPILPPYYSLRLLPFVVPQIETWKRRVLRERELGTDHEHHLHGV